MRLSLIAPAELGSSEIAIWRELQASNPALASPYFSPEFTLAVAAHRKDVRIGVLHGPGQIAGFWPHQATRGRGAPVGAGLSDHHGIVSAPGTSWDWTALLREADLAYWTFDHLPASQAPKDSKPACSPVLDLTGGFAAWRQRRIEAGVRRVTELERKSRKLSREVGPVRFEPHVNDVAVFETVLRLKSLQCRRTGVPDFFAVDWTRALVARIWQTRSVGLEGRLSALYAGDRLVAAVLGMRSPHSWHWWFPVYDAGQATYSPGGLLLLHVARTAAEEGHALLDLGKGDDPYKASFADASLPLAEGWVRRMALATLTYGSLRTARAWWTGSSLTQPLRPLLRPIIRRARSSVRAGQT